MLSERVDSDFDYQIVVTFILKNWRGLRTANAFPTALKIKNKKNLPHTKVANNNNKCTQEKIYIKFE